MGLGGFDKYDLLREELLVLNVREISCALLFWGGGLENNGLTAHS